MMPVRLGALDPNQPLVARADSSETRGDPQGHSPRSDWEKGFCICNQRKPMTCAY